MKVLRIILLLLFIFSLKTCFLNAFTNDINILNKQVEEIDSLIKKMESNIEKVCILADNKQLTKPLSYTFAEQSKWLQPIQLTFSKESFDQDLNNAFETIERQSDLRDSLNEEINSTRKKEKKKKRKKISSPEDAMRQAEEKTEGLNDSQMPANFTGFNIFEDYEIEHKRKIIERDKMAEADIIRVNQERRMAEMEIQAKEEYEQKIQQQNRRWQQELDDQAEKSAQEAAKWKREHSFGNFVKGLFRTTLSVGVSSLTGGFAGSVGAGAADLLTRKMFPQFKPSGEYDKELSGGKK